MFSTTDRGSRITTIAPGERIGRVTPGLAVGAVLTCATWTGLAFAAYPRVLGDGYTAPAIEEPAQSWWWIALCVLGVVALMVVAPRFYGALERRFGQQTFSFGFSAALAAVGFLIAGAANLRMIADHRASLPPGTPSWEGPDGMIVLIFTAASAVAAAGLLLWLPFAFFRARRRQRQVIRLRESGRRFTGEVDSLEFRHEWIAGRPQFDATIRYALGGETRTFRAAMATASGRVPLPGFPVRIMVDERSATLVEPDLDRPAAFDAETDYTEPSGGGGG